MAVAKMHRELSRASKDYLSHRLKVVREARNLRRADMARLAGVNWNTYKAYEEGKNTPGLPVLLALTRGLQLASLEELLGGIDVLQAWSEQLRRSKVAVSHEKSPRFWPRAVEDLAPRLLHF